MSPARLSVEEMSEIELSYEGVWAAQPNKKQKMQPNNNSNNNEEHLDMYDDIETLWETRWKSAVSKKKQKLHHHSFQSHQILIFIYIFQTMDLYNTKEQN